MELTIFSYITDLVFGDPRWFPHPVKIMGNAIGFLDQRLPRTYNKNMDKLLGVFAAVSIIAASSTFAYFAIDLAGKISPFLAKIVWVFIGYTTIAAKDLFMHAKSIKKELLKEDIVEARKALSLIVGRDTDLLSKEKIISATIESVSENTSDGIIAPLFYLFLGGPVLAIAYKAINTLDSMIAHKNEEYIDFGWCAAKLDDLANYIPARITGLLITIGAFLLRKDAKGALSVMLRDGRKHSSPNSAVPEASMAGALSIQIGGPCSYNGEDHNYPFIGEAKKIINVSLINEVINLSFLSSVLMVIASILIKQILF